MRAIKKILLIAVLMPLVVPFGFIAIMLSPFIELFYEEEDDDSE